MACLEHTGYILRKFTHCRGGENAQGQSLLTFAGVRLSLTTMKFEILASKDETFVEVQL